MTCINCGTEGTGTFCAHCGQKLEIKRLTFREGWHDFWARIYGFDGMFPRTFRDLTLRPGFATREFIRGNRIRYYGPVGYFFFMITCFLLLLSIIGLTPADYMKAMANSMPVQQEETKMSNDILNFVSDNIKIIAFIYIPFQAWASRYVFFRKQGLNFVEHSVLPLYVFGHWYWFQMLEAVALKVTGHTTGAVWSWVLTALFVSYAYTSFITTQPKWKTFLKGFGVYLTSYIALMLVIVVVTIVVFIVMALIDPSSLKQFKQ